MDNILKREFFEVDKNRASYDLHYFVLKMVERFGYSFAIDILKLNLSTLESLRDESSSTRFA